VVSQLAVTRAAVPQAFEQADAARNSLIGLLASTPEALADELPASVTVADPKLPRGDPLEVLLTPAQVIARRPDIQAAGFRLVSASANLKSALAQRYPQLTLGGLFGSAGTAVSQLMTPGSAARGFDYTLTLPLIDFGRIRAAIDAADAEQLEAYLSYEQTVRGALQATQTAIVMYAQGVLRERQMSTALESARTAARLARTQYQAGALALLNVLIAEQAEYSTELMWSEAAAAVAERLVALYQTMGVLPPTA
jgi:multidrug efflux system outer membrane protein